jgi:hypothetical protein
MLLVPALGSFDEDLTVGVTDHNDRYRGLAGLIVHGLVTLLAQSP